MDKIQSSLLFQVSLIFLFNSLGYACNVVANSIITHHLPLELYGDFFCAWMSLGLISQVLIFGTTLSANTFLASYHRKSDTHKKKSFIAWNIKLVTTAFINLSIVYLLFWIVAHITHFTETVSFDKYHMAAFTAILGPMLALSTIFNNYVLTSGRPVLSAFMSTAQFYFMKLLVFFCGFYFFIPRTELHLSLIIMVYLFILMIFSVICYGFLPENELINSISLLYSHKKDNKKSLKPYYTHHWMDISKASVLNTLVYTIATSADIYVLEIFSHSEKIVGIYSVCLISVGFIGILVASMNKITSTRVTQIKQLSEEETSSLQRSLNAINIGKLFIIGSSMCLYYLCGDQIFNFFNVQDKEYTILMPVLIFSIFLANLTGPRSAFLLSHDHQRFCITVQMIRMVLMIVLSIFLVHYYSAYGVAAANLMTSLIRLLLLTYKCRQLTSIRFNLFF